MTTTRQPSPGNADVEDHVLMSRNFLEQAKSELSKGDGLQASEKVWGAVAHALKAIGAQRGWRHRAHQNIQDIAAHMGDEFDRRDFFGHLTVAESMHQNFYENDKEEDLISQAIDDAETFLAKLDEVRTLPPRPYTISTVSAQSRLRRLLGLPRDEPPPMGIHSEVGFSLAHPENN